MAPSSARRCGASGTRTSTPSNNTSRASAPGRQVLPARLPRRATTTTPRPPGRPSQTMEVLAERHRRAGALRRLPAGLRADPDRDFDPLGAVVRHTGRPQAGHAGPRRRHRRRCHRPTPPRPAHARPRTGRRTRSGTTNAALPVTPRRPAPARRKLGIAALTATLLDVSRYRAWGRASIRALPGWLPTRAHRSLRNATTRLGQRFGRRIDGALGCGVSLTARVSAVVGCAGPDSGGDVAGDCRARAVGHLPVGGYATDRRLVCLPRRHGAVRVARLQPTDVGGCGLDDRAAVRGGHRPVSYTHLTLPTKRI